MTGRCAARPPAGPHRGRRNDLAAMPGATHLFAELGTLAAAAGLAQD